MIFKSILFGCRNTQIFAEPTLNLYQNHYLNQTQKICKGNRFVIVRFAVYFHFQLYFRFTFSIYHCRNVALPFFVVFLFIKVTEMFTYIINLIDR